MDFSLLQPDARRRFLRDLLGLKRQWPYYVIMVVDPILRFSWIFYAIFTHNAQHSTIVSFLVGVAEVTRRGMWALIRVENEHCFNVAAYKASRDLPLPYKLDSESTSEQASTNEPRTKSREENAVASAVDASGAASSLRMREEVGVAGDTTQLQPTPLLEAGISVLRRRRRSSTAGARSIRGIMAEAHRQDFEKKRRPLESTSAAVDEEDEEDEDEERDIDGSEDDENDDDDESDTASVHDERMQARRSETLVNKGG